MFRLAEILGKSISEIGEMDAVEFLEWQMYFKLKNEYEEKAFKEAEQKGGK